MCPCVHVRVCVCACVCACVRVCVCVCAPAGDRIAAALLGHLGAAAAGHGGGPFLLLDRPVVHVVLHRTRCVSPAPPVPSAVQHGPSQYPALDHTPHPIAIPRKALKAVAVHRSSVPHTPSRQRRPYVSTESNMQSWTRHRTAVPDMA
eukprot:2067996-Rhodomonas_salina.2